MGSTRAKSGDKVSLQPVGVGILELLGFEAGSFSIGFRVEGFGFRGLGV